MKEVDVVNILLHITFHQPSAGIILCIIAAVVLLLMSGFASGSEIAIFGLSPTDLSELDAQKRSDDRKILELREDGERTLATILITNNFINVLLIMLCNFIIDRLVHFGEGALWLQFIVTTVVLTFLLLLFGEIMPKLYSRLHPLKFCRIFVNYILIARRLFWPLENILLKSGSIASKVMQTENHVLSVDDLEHALQLTDREEIKDEESILHGIIRFGDETAKEVMTSRQDIICLDIRSTFREVLNSIVENNYSRIPIYQDSTDNIRGILYVKDLLPHIGKQANFRWQSLIRQPYFVPETKKIDDLMREFQKYKVHMAIVVDEFGGTSGLVTLEDILEEIVGEINDEYDEEERYFTRLNINTYIFEGKTLLSDFYRVIGVDESELEEAVGDADTLAGLILELKGDFPVIGEKLDYGRFTFEVTEIVERRISRVKVVVHENK